MSRICHAARRMFAASALIFAAVAGVICQSAVNTTGNGGNNTIQGRLSVTSGRSDMAGLRITLKSLEHGDLTVITDNTGGFSFRNLVAGSYTVALSGGDVFEDVQEAVYFDPIGNRMTTASPITSAAGSTVSVNLYLRPRRRASEGAPAVLEASLAAVPKAARDKYDAAQRAVMERNDAQATADLKEAVAMYPKFTLAWYQLGLILGRTGARGEAISALKRAVESDPKFTAGLLALGSALFEADQYKAAETYLAAALAADPSQYMAHYYLGMTEIKLQRLDIGEQALLKALELGGNKVARAHYYLGGIYWANKQYSKAAEHLEKYLAADPKAADADKVRRSIADLRSKT